MHPPLELHRVFDANNGACIGYKAEWMVECINPDAIATWFKELDGDVVGFQVVPTDRCEEYARTVGIVIDVTEQHVVLERCHAGSNSEAPAVVIKRAVFHDWFRLG